MKALSARRIVIVWIAGFLLCSAGLHWIFILRETIVERHRLVRQMQALELSVNLIDEMFRSNSGVLDDVHDLQGLFIEMGRTFPVEVSDFDVFQDSELGEIVLIIPRTEMRSESPRHMDKTVAIVWEPIGRRNLASARIVRNSDVDKFIQIWEDGQRTEALSFARRWFTD